MHDLVTGTSDRLFEVCKGGLRRIVLDRGRPGREVHPGPINVVTALEGTFEIEGTGRAVHPGDLQLCLSFLLRHDDLLVR